MSLIYASMAAGGPKANSVTHATGVGTSFDPRVGNGSLLTPGLSPLGGRQLITPAKDGQQLTCAQHVEKALRGQANRVHSPLH